MRILDNIGLVQDPIHLGAVILEKLIDDLKSKLPFLAKKKGNDDDLDEEDELGDTETETEVSSEDDEKTSVSRIPKRDDDTSVDEEMPDNSLVGKLKAKISALQKKKKSGDDLEDALSDESDVPVKEKKKPNLIVIIGAIGLMAFIFLSDFGDEEAPVADPAAMLKKRPKKEKPKTETPPTETTPTESAPTDTTPTDSTATTPVETTPTDTSVATDPTITEPATTETPVDTTVTTPTETTPTETAPTDTTSPLDTTVTTAPEDTTTPTESLPTDSTSTDTTTAPTTDNESPDSINGEETKTTDDNLTEQILKDLENQAQGTEKAKPAVKTEYVAPPNYENVGRGLVYNCTGKHWACIDGPSYKSCEDNASSVKYQGKKTECYPFNVYESQSGCEKTQNRMVSSSAKTEFCGE